MVFTRTHAFLAAAVILVIAVLVFLWATRPPQTVCDGIYEQALLRFDTQINLVKLAAAKIGIGMEPFASGGSQEAALRIKACCILREEGKLSEDGFDRCQSSVSAFAVDVDRALKNSQEAIAAAERGESSAVEAKKLDLIAALSAAAAEVRRLRDQSVHAARRSESSENNPSLVAALAAAQGEGTSGAKQPQVPKSLKLPPRDAQNQNANPGTDFQVPDRAEEPDEPKVSRSTSHRSAIRSADRGTLEESENTSNVYEASYGRNCRADQSGNATQFVRDYVTQNCAGKESCSIPVQEAAASKIGDHCPGVPKDFDVTYVCGNEEKTTHVPGESTGKTAFITCAK
jgi:hypothetical protein